VFCEEEEEEEENLSEIGNDNVFVCVLTNFEITIFEFQ
jgi:hypothetical protein